MSDNTNTPDKFMVLYSMELGREGSPPMACVIPFTNQLVERLLSKLIVLHIARSSDRETQLVAFEDTCAYWINPQESGPFNVSGDVQDTFLDDLMEDESRYVDVNEDPKMHAMLVQAIADPGFKTEMNQLCVCKHGVYWSAYYADTSVEVNSVPINQDEIESLKTSLTQ